MCDRLSSMSSARCTAACPSCQRIRQLPQESDRVGGNGDASPIIGTATKPRLHRQRKWTPKISASEASCRRKLIYRRVLRDQGFPFRFFPPAKERACEQRIQRGAAPEVSLRIGRHRPANQLRGRLGAPAFSRLAASPARCRTRGVKFSRCAQAPAESINGMETTQTPLRLWVRACEAA